MTIDPSVERVRECFDYNQDTGVFIWKIRTSNRIRVGDPTGCISTTDGYMYIRLDRRNHVAHRLAWAFVHGYFPPDDVDHINGIRSDNRIGNLREASRAENGQNRKTSSNNKSGVKGVCRHQKSGKWRAQVHFEGKQHFFGLYDSLECASEAARAGREKLHREFARHA